ncbi:MAG: response regulator [Nitrospirae bacterium]|nr:response regulator [Nitrospirota bacterium]
MEKIKILIVEDEAIIARDLQKRLENQGYIVTSASATGEDAIRRAGTESPDLVLMDIVLLGDMDGIDAAGQIRALYDIPVVYLTAYADEGILERAKVTEPFGYILKPFDDRELRSVIEMALYKCSSEKKLKQSNEFLNNVIEALSLPFYVINVDDYTVAMANSAANFGTLTKESTCHALTHHADSPCSGEEHPCTIRQIRETGKPVILEHNHYDNEGKARTYQIHGYPIRNKEGEVVQVIEYTLDITDKRLLETQLLQAQKMESVGRLAGGVAHDFNNLLSAILGYSELLLTELPEDAPARRDVGIISDAGNKAATLVRQLLAFSRKQVLEMKTVKINDLVENIAKMLRVVLGEDLILELNLNPAIRNVKADAGQIEQVLMNLAVNARDAMPCGGRLTVETENIELDEDYARTHANVKPGMYVMLAVTDTGAGMSRAVQEKIFEPFYTTKGSRGTGLGLSTVYGIVNQHGGNIYVYSEEGIGTTFKVYLPATVSADDVVAEAAKKTIDLRGKETVLVVDDEASIRRLIIDTLTPLGYNAIEASCGEEALQRSAMTKNGIDLLLTDVIMPDMNGHELAVRMKQMRPGMKIIFMSGYTDETIGSHGIIDPNIKFLQKPLTPKKFATSIRETLDEA